MKHGFLNNKLDLPPAKLEQLKFALREYALNEGIKLEFYNEEIKVALGLPKKHKCLHSNDPRYFYLGHKPSKKRQALYSRFINKVNKDFKFHEDNRSLFISVALNLGRFASETQESETKKLAQARKLNGKIYVSSLHADSAMPEKMMALTYMSFRWISETPFLLVHKFSSPTFRYGDKAGVIKSGKPAVELAEKLDIHVKDGNVPIINVERGIMVPSGYRGGYYGIMQTNDYLPKQLQCLAWNDEKNLLNGFTVKAIGASEEEALGLRFDLAEKLPNLQNIASKMGEPLL